MPTEHQFNNYIDLVEFGRMLAILERLEPRLKQAIDHAEVLEIRIAGLEEKYRMGKFGLSAILLVLGFALFGVKETISELFNIIRG